MQEFLEAENGMEGWYPVSDTHLPVLLPDIQDFKPLGTGKSPLANHPEFYEVPCPSCGKSAQRETDVTDVFLDSAWYFLRYLATDLQDRPFPAKDSNRSKFLPVNIYIGGAEHAVLHLLYARFITMVLKDLGHIDFEEPFTKFVAHGLLVKEGAKMSKSKGNVINPDEYIKKYGADTLRSYLMFLGPFMQGGDFYDTGIEGMYRFLRRVWVLMTQRVELGEQEEEQITSAVHKTIKGVTRDLEEFGYNTSLAKLMELYNTITKGKGEFDAVPLTHTSCKAFLQMLAPFAPHMTEELWNQKGYPDSIHRSVWPEYDEKYLVEERVTMAIQVNGKVRATLEVSVEDAQNQEKMELLSRNDPRIQSWVQEKEVQKVIFIPKKILNFVL